MHQADGSISMLSIFREITEKKAIEAELRQARKMESIGILAGGVAHDFNNFLQVIIGCTEMSLEEIPEQSPAFDYLKTIRQSSKRAKGVVRQLLNFSRKAEVKRKVIEMGDVVLDTLKLLRSTIPNTIDIQHHLPDRNLPILGDNVQISQILINICTNAYQAMEETGGVLTITVDTVLLGSEDVKGHKDLLPGEYVATVISDTGPGMVPEIKDYIFDPYFTTKEIGKGSGMGLAVAHGIVRNHDGIITVDSRLGQGAVFSIFFPLLNKTFREESKPEDTMQSGNERILFIDDDQLIVKTTGNILKRLGYSVVCRTDPLDALALFQTDPNQFDLVITDIFMPRMRGTELRDKLKNIRADIPIIVCTGYSAYADGEEAKRTGVNALVMKPFTPRDLAEAIRNVLD
jgi:nitrogen-specific signal transduction histidine kinase